MPTSEIYSYLQPLSRLGALPICTSLEVGLVGVFFLMMLLILTILCSRRVMRSQVEEDRQLGAAIVAAVAVLAVCCATFDGLAYPMFTGRSEEHTSELQSLMRSSYAVIWLKITNSATSTMA